MKYELELTAEQYESIKKEFTKIRKKNGMRKKGDFPTFVWYGDMERLECCYKREFDPGTGKDELVSAKMKWFGEEITHFYVDLKKLMKGFE